MIGRGIETYAAPVGEKTLSVRIPCFAAGYEQRIEPDAPVAACVQRLDEPAGGVRFTVERFAARHFDQSALSEGIVSGEQQMRLGPRQRLAVRIPCLLRTARHDCDGLFIDATQVRIACKVLD